MMTAQRLPIQPSLLMTMKSGTIPSCVGTAIVAMTKTSRPLRPRKRSLAKAKPAIAEKSTTSTATVELTRMLLPSAFQNGDRRDDGARVLEEVPARDERVRILHDGGGVACCR